MYAGERWTKRTRFVMGIQLPLLYGSCGTSQQGCISISGILFVQTIGFHNICAAVDIIIIFVKKNLHHPSIPRATLPPTSSSEPTLRRALAGPSAAHNQKSFVFFNRYYIFVVLSAVPSYHTFLPFPFLTGIIYSLYCQQYPHTPHFPSVSFFFPRRLTSKRNKSILLY